MEVENGYIWKVTPIGGTHFDFHDYGRKCNLRGLEVLGGECPSSSPRAAIISFMIRYGNAPGTETKGDMFFEVLGNQHKITVPKLQSHIYC